VTEVMSSTTGRLFMGTRPVASLHEWSMAEGTTETIMIYVMSSVPEMHVAGSKTSTEIESVKSKNCGRKGIMIITVLTITNLTRSGQQKWETSQEASSHTP
jgi:hypothetical protein